MPGNESSRIRQWERFVGEAVEQLRILKTYRTPQALRSFARLFTMILPGFYAPDFAQLARDSQSLALGLCFAILTSVALSALFEAVYMLEDPFVGHTSLDGIDVPEELRVLHRHQLLRARRLYFGPNAPPLLSLCPSSSSPLSPPLGLEVLDHRGKDHALWECGWGRGNVMDEKNQHMNANVNAIHKNTSLHGLLPLHRPQQAQQPLEQEHQKMQYQKRVSATAIIRRER